MSALNIPHFYNHTADAWEAMLRDIYSAEKTIDIEQYIFSHDKIGERFIDALLQKVKQGLAVRLFVDAVGSFSFYYSSLPEELRAAGIQIKFYNPVSFWRVTNYTSAFFRDHRKIMVVDGTIGHIGGVGIRDSMSEWHDMHVRIVGPIASEFHDCFEALWKGVSRWSFLRQDGRKLPKFTRKYNIVNNAPIFRRQYLYRQVLDEIRNARKYIFISTPYFVPDMRIYTALRKAARRGVDVRIVIPYASDHLFLDYARGTYYERSFEAGVNIYHFKPGMLHAKYVVIDDEWATVGSLNFDAMSFFFNHEANLTSYDQQFVAQLKEYFYDLLRSSVKVRFDEWIRRPFRTKVMEVVMWPFHRIL